MDDRESLLNDVLENPYDLGSRLVYADWLVEHGDPRGEFIHSQVEMETTDPWSPAYVDAKVASENLYLKFGDHDDATTNEHWDADLVRLIETKVPGTTPDSVPYLEGTYSASVSMFHSVRKFRYRSGFIDQLEVERLKAFQAIDRIRQLTPVRSLTFQNSSADRRLNFGAWNGLKTVRDLRLRTRSPQYDLHRLLQATDATKLESLSAMGRNLQQKNEIAIQLEKASDLVNLQKLDLSYNEFGRNAYSTNVVECDRQIEKISKGVCFSRLQSLSLKDNPISDRGMEYVASSACMPRLESLNIKLTNVQDGGLQSLAKAGMPKLKKLSMGWWFGNNASADGLGWFLQADSIGKLRELDLTGWPLTRDVVRELAECSRLSELRILKLGNTQLNDECARELAKSPYLSRLHLLDLSTTRITEAGLLKLVNSSVADGLTALKLSEVKSLRNSNFRIFADSKSINSIKYLDVSRETLTNDSLRAIAQSQNLSSLKTIGLSGMTINNRSVELLLRANGLSSLKQIDLRKTAVSKRNQNKLQSRFEGVFFSDGR